MRGAAVAERASPHAGVSAGPLAVDLGVVSVSRTGRDGVSYVARLVERAVRELAGRAPRTIDLLPSREGVVAPTERARLFWRLLQAQTIGRVDALVFTHLGPARAQRLVPARLRKPYAVFVHGIEMDARNMTAERLSVLTDAALRVANSRFTARRVEALYPAIGPVDACPLALLPSSPPRDAPDAALLARVAPRDVVLIVGRMSAGERYKGHDQLIEAWPEVVRRVPGAQLVVAGGGDDLDRLARKATVAGVGDRVLFCGRVSDATLEALFARAALFAMPSRGEGFGLVYLEAMRAGLPCIASPDDGGADVVVDGETGLLVPQTDVAGIAAAIATLLGDRERARSLGAAGRRRYEAEFRFEPFRDRLGALFERAFARGGAR